MKKLFFGTLMALILTSGMTANSFAAHLISYQGLLKDSGGSAVTDSTYSVKFSLHTDSTAGFQIWTETAPVETSSGLFVHLLGSVTLLHDSIFQNNDNLFLQLTVGGSAIFPRSRLATAPFSISSANLKMKDSSGNIAAKTDANQRSFSIYDSSETEVIRLSGNDSANQAVILPESAIDYSEILDEPGLTASINVDQVSLFTGEMTDLVTIDITTPADGYILLHGKCYLLLSGTTGSNNAYIQIDDDENGPSEFPYYTIAGLSGYVNTGTSYFPIYVTRIFSRPAGTYTFRMEGRASFPPPAEAKTWDHYLTAVYYPTAYNAVKALTNNPAGFVNPVQIDISNRADERENGTYYEVDLRNKTKAAKDKDDK